MFLWFLETCFRNASLETAFLSQCGHWFSNPGKWVSTCILVLYLSLFVLLQKLQLHTLVPDSSSIKLMDWAMRESKSVIYKSILNIYYCLWCLYIWTLRASLDGACLSQCGQLCLTLKCFSMCLLMSVLSLLVLLHKSQFHSLDPVSSTTRLIDWAIMSSSSAIGLYWRCTA